MNRKKGIIVICIICIVCISSIVFFFLGNNEGKIMRYNNTSKASSLNLRVYKDDEIEYMNNEIINQHITNYDDLNKIYPVMCLRKTFQGYYAVFLQNDEKEYFVFFDKHLKIKRYFFSKGFKSEKELKSMIHKGMKNKDVMSKCSNLLPTPISAKYTMISITKEGVCIIDFKREENGTLLQEPVVSKSTYIQDSDLIANKKDYLCYEIPFVLKIDKE